MLKQNRQLAAILFTDIVGYTAMMQQDEQRAVAVTRHYVTVLKKSVAAHHGKILNDYGDGSLCAFPSATEAMKAAIEIQQQLLSEPVVPLRIGLHLGEIFYEGAKVMGDSINIASRIQSLGQANTILFSKEIFDKIKNQQDFKAVSLGRFEFKNVDEPMEIFALANQGLRVPKREELSGKLKEIQKKTLRKGIIIAATSLIVLASAFFVYKNVSGTTGFTGEKSIAVLPFENKATDSAEEYISDGITQDIISNLAKISSLKKVIGWISVKNFKKTTKQLNEIAKELGVAAILSGSMQKRNDKTVILAELTEVATGRRLWGDDFAYDNKDISSIQSKIASQIVSALSSNLTLQEKESIKKESTENPEAFKLYNKGRYFWNKNTQAGFDSAEVYYKQALDFDPNFALAFSGLADCYIFSRKIKSQLEGVPVAKSYAEKALSLDSNLCEALTTLGWIQGVFDYDWAKSKITLQKALKHNPNYGQAHLFYGNLLLYTGENPKFGFEEVRRAIELDPLNARFNWVLGRNYFLTRQYDPAINQVKKTLLLDPGLVLAKGTLIRLYLKKKQYPEAFAVINQLPKNPVPNSDYQAPHLCYAYVVSGDTASAKTELKNSLKEYPDIFDISPYQFAIIYIALKDYDTALELLEKAYEKRDIALYWFKIDPAFDPIRNEPRFKALLKKMGLE